MTHNIGHTEPHYCVTEADLKAERADERRATVERIRPYFETLADSFDRSPAKPGGRFADELREKWREMHDAILDTKADE